jgi:hypothetical protein
MNMQRLLLAALILSVSGWASASVPVIELHESRKVEVNFYSIRALNDIFFGIKNHVKSVAIGAEPGVPDLHDVHPASGSEMGPSVFSGASKSTDSASVLTGQQISEGSFSSYASTPLSSASIAPVFDVGILGPELRDDAMVALPRAPKLWAILLLVLACVIYQGRRRQRPFGFRKID